LKKSLGGFRGNSRGATSGRLDREGIRIIDVKHPSTEELLGYLLGALEPEEHRRVDRLLVERPELQEELAEMRQRLVPLARVEETEAKQEFPAGLARRACEYVARQARRVGSAPATMSTETALDKTALDNMGAVDTADTERLAVGSAVMSGPEVVMSPIVPRFSAGGSWQLPDFIVVAAVAALVFSLLTPALVASRNQTRLAACQDNLRRIGMGLFNYAEANHNRFVPIAQSGPLSVAGAYAPVLKSGGWVDREHLFFCGSAVQDGLMEVTTIPSLHDLEKAFRQNSEELAQLQSIMGGSYGYSLGYYEQDRYYGPMNLGRSYRVIMADTPNYALAARVSSNHGGSGQNMLFEDGSIRFSQSPSVGTAGDSIFVNRNGLVAAGTDVHDSVIGASNVSAWLSPSFYRLN